MNILILGCGGVGSVLAQLLAKETNISSVVLGDIRPCSKPNNNKISTKKLDIRDKTAFIKYLENTKPDILVNASLPKFNLILLDYCLRSKVNYFDMASFWDVDPNPKAKIPYKMEQLDFDSKFKKAGITGLINAGVSPGLTNLIAKDCADKLDKIDFVKIRLVEDTGSNELFFSWNKDWLLDEIATKPLVYHNHKFKIEESFSGEEEFQFPKPIGKRKVYYFAQDEVGSLPTYIKTKNLDVKAFDNNIEVSKLLVKLNLTSNKKIAVGDCEVSPLHVLSKVLPDSPPGYEKKFRDSIFAISIEVLGKSTGKKKRIKYSVVFPVQKDIEKLKLGANFISYPTAISAKWLIMALPKTTLRGVFPPEALEKNIREYILHNLSKEKLTISKS